MDLTPLQKLPKNVWDLSKIIVAKGFKKLPKVQKIALSGHTAYGGRYGYFAIFSRCLANNALLSYAITLRINWVGII